MEYAKKNGEDLGVFKWKFTTGEDKSEEMFSLFKMDRTKTYSDVIIHFNGINREYIYKISDYHSVLWSKLRYTRIPANGILEDELDINLERDIFNKEKMYLVTLSHFMRTYYSKYLNKYIKLFKRNLTGKYLFDENFVLK